jgi:hypothetical protein
MFSSLKPFKRRDLPLKKILSASNAPVLSQECFQKAGENRPRHGRSKLVLEG